MKIREIKEDLIWAWERDRYNWARIVAETVFITIVLWTILNW